jgi:hypothetical protein
VIVTLALPKGIVGTLYEWLDRRSKKDERPKNGQAASQPQAAE